MFTGIVETLGRMVACTPRADGIQLRFSTGGLPLEQVSVGDSIAVNGVCLTVTRLGERAFDADVSSATLSATTLGALGDDVEVNLERALTLTTALSGHLVSGHVDGIGEVVVMKPTGESRMLRVRVPTNLAHYVARKGSVCVDGVSLTVNAVAGNEFEVNLVPHTLERTTLGALDAGARVNIEVDMIARYLERLLLRTDSQ